MTLAVPALTLIVSSEAVFTSFIKKNLKKGNNWDYNHDNADAKQITKFLV